MRYLNLSLSLLFLVFATVQYNDPDGFLWIFIYLIPAFLFGLNFFRISNVLISQVLLIVTIASLLIYIPDIHNWIDLGCPSIIKSMKASSPHVEFVREFLGLVIIGASLYFYPKMTIRDAD